MPKRRNIPPNPKDEYRGLNIANTILGVPYYDYGYTGPQNPILIMKAPVLVILKLKPRSLRNPKRLNPKILNLQLARILNPKLKTPQP